MKSPIIHSKYINRYPLREFEDITTIKPLKGEYINPTGFNYDEIKCLLNKECNWEMLWDAFSKANPELLEVYNSIPDPTVMDKAAIVAGVISEFPVVDIRHYCIKRKQGVLTPDDVEHYTPLEKMIQEVATWRLSPTQLAHIKAQFRAEFEGTR